MKYLFEWSLFALLCILFLIWIKVNEKESFEMVSLPKSVNPFITVPEEMIVWKPHAIDIYHQPTYSAYFFDNHYMYPVY